MIRRCDLVPQYQMYQPEVLEIIEKVLQSGRYVLAEQVKAFEKEFSEYVDCSYGVGVNSGTDALVLALSCFDLQPGDEVITTPFTAIPTYAAIRHTGAIPMFVDIDPETFLMDVDQVRNVIGPRTRAVVPVHLFGNVVNVARLREIVGPDIYILEDCCQSHGASIHDRITGSLGDAAAFSFYPTKNLGGYGDGGIVTTNRQDIAEKIRLRRMYGMINKDEFIIDGINSRLDELQAAVLRVKLKHLDEMNQKRTELAAMYKSALDPQHIQIQTITSGGKSVYHVYSVLCRDRRDELAVHLENLGIQTNVYYPMPLYRQQGARAHYKEINLPVVEYVSQHILALPFYPEIAVETLLTIAKEINLFYS